jgi:radical SAM superfamily enzyme YgiQ (UPF0313 family)
MNLQETLLVSRPAKSQAEIGVSWVYPNTYEVGIAGLGYQLIWWLLEQDTRLLVHRVFTDYQENGWQDDELVGVTLAWELDYANVFSLLRKRGIALLSSQRDAHDPLVFGGGPVLSANPEPFADFFDVILTGDAEVVIPQFIDKWQEARELPERKQQLLALSQVPGIYVPSLYHFEYDTTCGGITSIEPSDDSVPAFVRRPVFMPPSDYVAHSVILTPEGSWGDMFLVEVVRSCPQECRFCLASYLTRPFRSANVDTLMDRIDFALRYTQKIGLLGPSVTEHQQFQQLAERLLARGSAGELSVSVASIRADSIDPLVLKMLVGLGQKSVTIALESGSERLRSIMKKNLTEQQFEQAMELIAGSGLSGVKLYGIAGLPGEEQADLDETIRLLTATKKRHKHLRITFGVSSFVPKAQTPFQWHGRDRQAGKKIEYLRKHLAKTGIEVRPESHNWSDVQALLSRGDRRLGAILLSLPEGGANLGAWKRALRNPPVGCPPADYFMYRDIPYGETLPWQHLMDDAKAVMLQKHSQTAEELALTLQPVARG